MSLYRPWRDLRSLKLLFISVELNHSLYHIYSTWKNVEGLPFSKLLGLSRVHEYGILSLWDLNLQLYDLPSFDKVAFWINMLHKYEASLLDWASWLLMVIFKVATPLDLGKNLFILHHLYSVSVYYISVSCDSHVFFRF